MIFSFGWLRVTGLLYVAINTSRTINCSVPDVGLFFSTNIVIQNGTVLRDGDLPGIMFTRTQTSSSLTISTADTYNWLGMPEDFLVTTLTFTIPQELTSLFYGMLVKFFIILYQYKVTSLQR